jgi:uncharacterized protein
LFDTGFIYLTMIVDLAEIEGSPRPFEFMIAASDLDLDNEISRLTDDVRVSGEVLKSIAQTGVWGSIAAEAQIDCMRCLKPVSHKLKIEFGVSFVTPENFAADKEREVSARDLDTDVLDGDRIDLKEVVREQLLLNLPGQLFCRVDCKGLCPKCGADLNLIDCKCDLDEADPRWEALKDFRF